MRGLGCGVENGAESDVVHTGRKRGVDLRITVRRNTNQRVWRQDFSRDRNGHVILTKMQMRAHQRGHIRSIVHDKKSTCRRTSIGAIARRLEQLTTICRLPSQLNNARAPLEERSHKRQRIPSCDGGIDDGVQATNSSHAVTPWTTPIDFMTSS